MPRLRLESLKLARGLAFFLACLGAPGLSGCSRYAQTRVFLHGAVVDEDDHPVPFAIVRQDDFETISDEKGHYRMLFLARCLRGGIGIQGVQTPEVQVLATGFKPLVMGYHLDTIELIGGGSCPKDSDRFLKLVLAR